VLSPADLFAFVIGAFADVGLAVEHVRESRVAYASGFNGPGSGTNEERFDARSSSFGVTFGLAGLL
jgi:hypothetical protein